VARRFRCGLEYEFDLLSDDGAKVYVDEKLIVSDDTLHPAPAEEGTSVKGGRKKQQRTWGLTMSLATPSCVQKLQTASHVTSCVFSESRMR
jgi:hypothetical protein